MVNDVFVTMTRRGWLVPDVEDGGPAERRIDAGMAG